MIFQAMCDRRRDAAESKRAAEPAPAESAGTSRPLWRSVALGSVPGQRVLAQGLRVEPPDDAFEREADAVAEQVVDGPGAAGARPRARLSADPSGRGHAPGPGRALSDVLADSGEALNASARDFFEPRFASDLGSVRLHRSSGADRAARALGARAFTLGADVFFAAGEHDVGSSRGRALLAHELAHVLQQAGGAPARIRRRLRVDPARPTDPHDPLSTLAPAAFRSLAFGDMGALVHRLCSGFGVDARGDAVSSPATLCNDLDAVATGGNPLGCCCLCALTAAGAGSWTIHVTAIGGPRTRPNPTAGGGDVFLHPHSSGIGFGAWSAAGARELADPVVVAGHELCGHGALMERRMHPAPAADRVDTDVHDPTVRIENLIRAEQGLPGARGLAADPHRGESFARITLRRFPFNRSTVAGLPAAERAKIQLAKDFINASDTWVDLFGHSDRVGPPAAKRRISRERADAVRNALTTGTGAVPATITKTFVSGPPGAGSTTVTGNRFTRVEGRSDTDAIAGEPPEGLRRVDIDMAGRPAGAEVPIPGTPTTAAQVGPASPWTLLARRFFGNPCDRLLARSAWA